MADGIAHVPRSAGKPRPRRSEGRGPGATPSSSTPGVAARMAPIGVRLTGVSGRIERADATLVQNVLAAADLGVTPRALPQSQQTEGTGP